MTDVVVVGAGAAGLAAAQALHEAGADISVLEARERCGGRVFTRHDVGWDVPIELGAEFVHGTNPSFEKILRQARLFDIDIDGERWQRVGSRLRPLDDFWEQLDTVMRRLKPRSRHDFSFREFLDSRPGGSRLARQRRLALQWVEGFHAADPGLISAHALALAGWPGSDLEQRRLTRVSGGYGRLLEWLATPVASRIQFASIVARIMWRPGHVDIQVRQPDGREKFMAQARAVVVTVPVGVLKAPPGELGSIAFEPALEQKTRALDRMASGSVVKVILRLRERVWASERNTLTFLHSTDDDFPIWWTAYPERTPMLTAWRGGPGARRLSQLPRVEIEVRALAALARQLAISRRRAGSLVEGMWIHDWEHDPFARGAYSYILVGGAGAARALARPVRGTLFFAGEAAAPDGNSGTVDAAIMSGREAAARVLRAL
jgi:monoamine oxidase